MLYLAVTLMLVLFLVFRPKLSKREDITDGFVLYQFRDSAADSV